MMGCALPGGVIVAPPRDQTDETKWGFTVGDRVEVMSDSYFQGWFGHVRSFDSNSIAVDLDEPPEDHSPNGQWFNPDKLRKAPR